MSVKLKHTKPSCRNIESNYQEEPANNLENNKYTSEYRFYPTARNSKFTQRLAKLFAIAFEFLNFGALP
jgi:hypothetical protein